MQMRLGGLIEETAIAYGHKRHDSQPNVKVNYKSLSHSSYTTLEPASTKPCSPSATRIDCFTLIQMIDSLIRPQPSSSKGRKVMTETVNTPKNEEVRIGG